MFSSCLRSCISRTPFAIRALLRSLPPPLASSNLRTNMSGTDGAFTVGRRPPPADRNSQKSAQSPWTCEHFLRTMLLIIWLTFDNVCLQLQHTKCATPQASCRRPTWVCASWESRERSAAPNAFSPLARVARAASGCLELHPPRALARSMSARHSCMQSEAGIRVLRPSRVVPCESLLHLHFGRRSRNARAGCPSPADLINSTTFLFPKSPLVGGVLGLI